MVIGSGWAGEPVLRLPEQHGAGARAVPPHGRQEVAVLPRRGAGPQVLRPPRPPRPQPFKKACGRRSLPSRVRSRPGAERRHHGAAATHPRLLPRRQHPPRHMSPWSAGQRPARAFVREKKSCNEICRDFVASCRSFFHGNFFRTRTDKSAEFDGMRLWRAPTSLLLCVRL
jgi:hypothetical protein